MDKEDCIEVLLSTLRQPQWRSCDSVTDWDLKNVLWKAGLLLAPEQVAALFADVKRRGLISAYERRSEDRVVAMWRVKVAPAGEEWLAQREQATLRQQTALLTRETPLEEDTGTEEPTQPAEAVEAEPGEEASFLPRP